MKNLIYILLLVFISQSVFAAQADTVTAIITYVFVHEKDTTKGSKPYTENMDLYLARNSSWYKSGDKAKADSAMAANFKASGNTVINVIPYSKEELFMNFAEHKFFIKNKLSMNNYLMEDSWPAINWKITAETIVISGLKCQKALGSWRGRTYSAWFCTELPYHAGPWKLNGLPGLIVEAYDSKKEVVFKFAGFRTLKNSTEIIALPTNVIKTTIPEYNKMVAAFYKDRAGFINGSSGQQVILTSSKSSSTKPGTNNPLELSGN
jgi:GLPGLI family protein